MSNGYGSGKDTRQTALRDLYAKLGGNIADVAEENDINRLIRDLGNVAGGTGGGALIVHDTDGTLDKTWAEINAAAPLAWISMDGGYLPVGACFSEDGEYFAIFAEISDPIRFLQYKATTEDGYPELQT